MVLTILVFIIVLSVIVFAHEFGHFWTARIIGLKPKEFGIGIPPRIIGVYKSREKKWKFVWGRKEVTDADDTVYSINWLPIGGFVQLGEDELESDDERHFINKTKLQRAFVLSAGVIMNIILAVVLISVGYLIGFPQSTRDLNSRAIVDQEKIQVFQVMEDSPAQNAGLTISDEILSVNNEKIVSETQLQDIVDQNTGKEIEFLIRSGGEEKTLNIIPEIREETNRGGVGISIVTTAMVRYPWYLALWEGTKTTIFLLGALLVAFYELIRGLIVGGGVSVEVAGPIGIANLTGQFARMGFVYLLQFTALFSLNLAIINLIPFPALDGGRLLFIIIEAITGKKINKKIESSVHNIGFVILLLLILVVTFKDVLKLFN